MPNATHDEKKLVTRTACNKIDSFFVFTNRLQELLHRTSNRCFIKSNDHHCSLILLRPIREPTYNYKF